MTLFYSCHKERKDKVTKNEKSGSKLYLGVKFRAFIFLHKKIGIDTQIHYN